jgi:hypothetical protein
MAWFRIDDLKARRKSTTRDLSIFERALTRRERTNKRNLLRQSREVSRLLAYLNTQKFGNQRRDEGFVQRSAGFPNQ